MRRAMLKVTSYAMFFLLAMVLAGLFSSLYIQQLIISLGFLAPIVLARFWRDNLQFPDLSRAFPKSASIFLLFPFLLFLLRAVGTFTASLFLLFNVPLPQPQYPQSFWVAVLLFAVLPAICEEFFSRYVILGTLLPEGRVTAVFVSALTFGLAHMNFYQIPYAFVSGLVFGFVVVYSGSLLPAILFHFFNNLFSVILVYAQQANEALAVLFALLYSFLIFVLAAILTPIFFLKNRKSFKPRGVRLSRLREIFLSPYLVFVILTLALATYSLVVSVLYAA